MGIAEMRCHYEADSRNDTVLHPIRPYVHTTIRPPQGHKSIPDKDFLQPFAT